jgi:DNA-binding NarL/FixJ family response regulator
MTKLRIFVACADERLRIALLLFLEYEPGIIVVGITDRLPSLLPQLAASQPDVLILEWEIPFQAMADLLTEIHNLESSPMIIFSSNKPDEEEKYLAAGVDHFIAKNNPPDELLPILHKTCTPIYKNRAMIGSYRGDNK